MELETLGPEKVLLLEKRKEVLEDVLQLPVLGICSNQPELLKTFSNSEHPHTKIVCHHNIVITRSLITVFDTNFEKNRCRKKAS